MSNVQNEMPIHLEVLAEIVRVRQQRDELLAAAKNLRDVKGRYHSEQAFNALVDVIAQVDKKK